MKLALGCLLAGVIGLSAQGAGLDRDGNGRNDVWELVYNARALSPNDDTDGDGITNGGECLAGTDPRDATSAPPMLSISGAGAFPRMPISFRAIPGKQYRLLTSSSLTPGLWATNAPWVADRPDGFIFATTPAEMGFFRVVVDESAQDTDGDGLTDYEEGALGFDPRSTHTARYQQADLARATKAIDAASVVTISALDPLISERWPDPGLVAIRRRGGLTPLTIPVSFGGTAEAGRDYEITSRASGSDESLLTLNSDGTGTIHLPAAVREVWIEFHPVADALDAEPSEEITVTLLAGSGFSLSGTPTVKLSLENQTAASGPSAKEAARFLIQAAFGPDQDSPDDADYLPENLTPVMTLGIPGWIEDQFNRPVGWLQPYVDWVMPVANSLELYGDVKNYSWWGRVMGSPKLRPDAAETVQPDPLRQRMAFALSEIFVISDRLEDLGVEQRGMANYYDVLLKHAFGNYRDLLLEAALHPCMGMYLSHLGNKKADLAMRVYPDENFAREIMQLFTIGLWELNPDGTRKLDRTGAPIPTYSNDDITELARVFTGLAFGGTNTNFGLHPRDFTKPMKMWDQYHDCGTKTLLTGLKLPARTASSGNQGLAGMPDVEAAVLNLFNHPNVGPFIGRQLIQRFVTSNPSPEYVARVAATFANNGAGVRGDLKAVLRAILLDTEARNPANMASPTFGKLREPLLKFANFARAFNAASTSGHYVLDQFTLDHLQDPFRAPSVFNFFQPAHSPPGPIADAGLVAPEFQIINASTAVAAPNHYWNAILGDLHRWGSGRREYSVRLNLTQELTMVVPAAQVNQDVPSAAPYDPDPLLRRLDMALTGGRLSKEQFQIIRETLERVPRPSWHWHRDYLRVAIYLVVTSPDFSVMK